MRAQAALVRSWTGPVVVLQEMDSVVATCRGAPLHEALDAAAAHREQAGSGYHLAPLAGGLAAAVVLLLEFADTRWDFLITGVGSAIAEAALLLEEAGGVCPRAPERRHLRRSVASPDQLR
jgi:hypothetical protein